MTHTHPRLRGLAALALITVLLAGPPAALIGLGAAPWTLDLHELRLLLLSPDDGTLALTVIGIVAWAAWAFMAFCLISETTALARGRRPRRLPVMAPGQRLAGHLVAAAALAFTIAPQVSPAVAAPLPDLSSTPVPEAIAGAGSHDQSAPLVDAERGTAETPPATTPYTTRTNDSLWKIAETHLGSGSRFTEIVDLNPGVFPDGPGFLTAGTVLQLPAINPLSTDEATLAEPDTYVVEPGDTLWDIADEELGDPTRYDEIFDASQHTEQPNGQHLTDPDLILPGWQLTIPADDAPPAEAPASPEQDVVPAPPAESPAEAPTEPPQDAEPAPAEEPTSVTDEDKADSNTDARMPSWLLPGLAGSGALVAGALYIVVRGHRRTRLRYRSPGEVLETPPAELGAVEKTTRRVGAVSAHRIEDLDRLLRHLAEGLDLTGQPLPSLTTIKLGETNVELHLDAPAPSPPGWQGDDSTWTFALDESLPEADRTAPWPLLCSLGQSDDGSLVLVNLEALGHLSIHGDRIAGESLARSIAAELSLSPWAVLAEVDVIGMGEELAHIAPIRLHHHAADDVAFLTRIETDLAERRARKPETFRTVIAATPGATRPLTELIDEHPNAGTAVVVIENQAPADGAALEITSSGRLIAHDLGLELRAAGLTAEEAAASAALVAVARDAVPVEPPSHTAAEPQWRVATDRSGSLTGVYADAPPEPSDHATPGVKDHDSTPSKPLERHEVTDPTLDDDLAAWFDKDCPLPRLHVLGPVRATACGDVRAVARRKPHYVELLAYLALHPEGVTTTQLAEAFSLRKERVRTDVGIVRKWLGDNPRTGQPHLPPAAQSHAADQTGVWTYQVDDVLVDADLFRRLRARAESRGDDGQADLDAALRLVEGAPFSDLRETGWSWLLDADSRDDEILACAIVDVAHSIVTDAIAHQNVERAAAAVEVARTAAPYDEIARLDHAAVLVAQGHEEAAREFLNNAIYNRSDDHLGPIEIPERTAGMLRKQPLQ